MDENPYKAPIGGLASTNAWNWNPFALGVATGCAIAVVMVIVGTIALGVAVSKQVDGERRFRENARAREAARKSDGKDAARLGPATHE